MKKMVLLLAVMAVVASSGYAATTYVNGDFAANVGWQNDPYASQISYDSFNFAVKQRMAIARLGQYLAPRSTNSRQVDCNYYNGFTIWGDAYGGWANQSSRGTEDGYRFRVGGPALGFDWSNGAFTAGLATTYNWGKIEGRGIKHDRDTRTFALTGYAQWTNGTFYVNSTLGYARNTFEGTHYASRANGVNNEAMWGTGDYHSDAWNANIEAGYKILLKGFAITPNVGLRYFHDKGKTLDDQTVFAVNGINAAEYRVSFDRNSYHVLELPLGVNFGYEILAGGATIVPQARFAWIPELDRKRGSATGWDSNGNYYSIKSPKRNSNGFLVGAGVEAKITSSISAFVDYNAVLRSRAWEQHLNLGVGFTF